MKKLPFFLLVFSIVSIQAFASNYYWVGGTGNWSEYAKHWATTSGGSTFQKTVPTSKDDVFFDAKSFTKISQVVTLDSNAYCHSMDWTGAAKSPTLAMIEGISVYGSLRLISSISMTNNNNFGRPNFQFLSNDTGNVISTGSHDMFYLLFNGKGNWKLKDSLYCSYQIAINSGSFYSNNYNINTSYFFPRANYPYITDLGTSTIRAFYLYSESKITGNSNVIIALYLNTYYSTTFNQVIMDGTGISIDSTNIGTLILKNPLNNSSNNGAKILTINQNNHDTIHKAIFSGTWELRNSFLFDTVECLAGSALRLDSGTTQNIRRAFISDGNCRNRVNISSNTIGKYASISKTSGSLTLDYVNLENIHAIGGATFTANNAVDLGGNSGLTINKITPAKYYWIGGSGNWSDGAHWATSSGGSGSGCGPSPADDVFFDAKSFPGGGTVTVDSVAYCHSMDWTGAKKSPVLSMMESISFYGSMKLIPAMTVNNNSRLAENFLFLSNDTGNTIASGGHGLHTILFDGLGAWTLQDSISSDYVFYINHGTLNTNNNNINASLLSDIAPYPAKLNLGRSKLRILNFQGQCQITGNSRVISSSTFSVYNRATFDSITLNGVGILLDSTNVGTLILNNPYNNSSNNSAKILSAYITGKDTIHKVIMSGAWDFRSSFVIDTLECLSGSSLMLDTGTTQTILSTILSDGSCKNRVNISSSILGKPAYISKTSGSLTMDYVNIRDIIATGGATFTVNEAADLGGNSGMTINKATPTKYYWVGGTGNWSDGKHWSPSSGGSGSGCVPNPYDDVFFDANSFSSAGATVTVDSAAYCHSMDWTGAKKNPTLSFNQSISFYGSLKFISAMTVNNNGRIAENFLFLSNDTGNKITSAGQGLHSVRFNGYGDWTLQDSIYVDYIFTISSGTLNSNNQVLNTTFFYARAPYPYKLNLGTSIFRAYIFYGECLITGKARVMFSGQYFANSHKASFGSFTTSNGALGSDIAIDSTTIGTLTLNNTNNLLGRALTTYNKYQDTIGKIILNGTWEFMHSFIYDTLQCSSGSVLKLDSGTVQTINKEFFCYGDPSGFCNIQTPTSTGKATISKPSGKICIELTYLKNIIATGGASFTAGNNCVDLGGNSGWAFSSSASCLPRIIKTDSSYLKASYCAGSAIKVPYTFSGGKYNSNNYFIAQLSDSTGNFSKPDSIGVLNTNKADTIHATLPVNILKKGTGYRIRVVSTSPTVTGSDNKTDITIYPLPASPSLGKDTSICPNTSLKIGTTYVNGIIYSWKSIPSGFSSSSSITTVKPISSTEYILKVSDSISGCSNSDSLQVNMLAIPAKPSILSNSPVCEEDTIILKATKKAAFNYHWSGPSGFSSTTNNPYIANCSLANAGTYKLTVDSAGCTSLPDSVLLNINAGPSTNLGNDTTVCIGVKITLGTSSVAGDTYSWKSKPSGLTDTSSTVSISPLTKTIYYLTETNSKGCKKTDSITIMTNPLPKALTGKNYSICSGQYASLGDSSVNGNLYAWTSSNRKFTSAKSHTSDNPFIKTVYYLTETITGTGCKKTDSITIDVNPLPKGFSLRDTSVCKEKTLVIGDTAVPGYKYQWTSLPSGFSSSLSHPLIAPLVSKIYIVSISSSAGCTTSDSIKVGINPNPSTPIISANNNFCEGRTLHLNTTANPLTNYIWNGPNGFSSIVSKDSISNTSVNNSGYYFLHSDSGGCSSKADSIYVKINPNPNSSFSGKQNVCKNSNETYTTFNDSISTYKWLINGVNILSGQNSNNLNVNWKDTGLHTISLKMKTKFGCTDSSEIKVIVNANPKALFSITPVCENSFSLINDSSILANKYFWNFGDGSSSANKENSHYYKNAGLYNIKLRVENNKGCMDSINQKVTIYKSPDAFWVVSDKNGSTLSFLAKDTNLTQYTWSFGDSTNAKLPHVSHKFNITGSYLVTLSTKNNNGCISSHDSTISFSETFNFRIGFYPNPFAERATLTYELPNPAMVKIMIYDMLGKEICTLANEAQIAGVHSYRIDADLYNLAAAPYLLKAIINGKIYPIKIISQY